MTDWIAMPDDAVAESTDPAWTEEWRRRYPMDAIALPGETLERTAVRMCRGSRSGWKPWAWSAHIEAHGLRAVADRVPLFVVDFDSNGPFRARILHHSGGDRDVDLRGASLSEIRAVMGEPAAMRSAGTWPGQASWIVAHDWTPPEFPRTTP